MRPLVTESLSMSVSSVSSERADELTGGLWSSEVGAPWDQLPEVPPDGKEGAQQEARGLESCSIYY